MKKIFNTPRAINLCWLAGLVLIEALAMLIIIVALFDFIPIKIAAIAQGEAPQLLKLFQPEREISFYRFFIISALVMMAVSLWVLRHKIDGEQLTSGLQKLVCVDGFWVALQLFIIFKRLQYNQPPWAVTLFWCVFSLSLLSRLFWPEISLRIDAIKQWLSTENVPRPYQRGIDVGVGVFLIMCLGIFYPIDAVARAWVWDGLAHVGQFTTTWGVGVVMKFLSSLTPAQGPVEIMAWSNVLVILYYAGIYYVMRLLLENRLLAIGAVLLAIKLQLFHVGTFPLVWITPERTPLRHVMDIAVLGCLVQYDRLGARYWLWGAAVGCGVALAYVMDTGIYLTVAFWIYIAFMKDKFNWQHLVGLALLPLIVMYGLWLAWFGKAVLTPGFIQPLIQQLMEYCRLKGAVPIISCLKDRHFFAYFTAFIIPIFLIGSALFNAARFIIASDKKAALYVVISVYGIGLYLPFLFQSSISDYYLAAVPLCMLMAASLKALAHGRTLLVQRSLYITFVVLSAGALLTNSLFTIYPNILSMANSGLKQERMKYQQMLEGKGKL